LKRLKTSLKTWNKVLVKMETGIGVGGELVGGSLIGFLTV
jgi:hypothetical protein